MPFEQAQKALKDVVGSAGETIGRASLTTSTNSDSLALNVGTHKEGER